MPKIIHLKMLIRGALRQSDSELAGMFQEAGRTLGALEAREYLLDMLEEGKKYLPLSDECEGFCYKTGCPGHETE